MTISINWPTSVIYVPRDSMELKQSFPVEIRQLDIDIFRKELKSLEDDIEGIVWTVTHVHNPPFVVGGVTLARSLELYEPYTVTFEDGQYAVNIIGGNSNIGDKVNVNQVSVRSANSAGLIESPDYTTMVTLLNIINTFVQGKVLTVAKFIGLT